MIDCNENEIMVGDLVAYVEQRGDEEDSYIEIGVVAEVYEDGCMIGKYWYDKDNVAKVFNQHQKFW